MRHKFRNFSDCEFPDYCDYAQKQLQERLVEKGFPVMDTLYINGHRNIQKKGISDEFFYIAGFHKDKDGRISLKCSAGFTHVGDQFKIEIPIPESEIKKSYTSDAKKMRLIRDLIRHMGKNQMEPEADLILDGAHHEYDAYVDGKHKKARYLAYWRPFGHKGPRLMCSYGLVESNAQFTYSSEKK